WTKDLPLDYKLQITTAFPKSTYVFTEDEEGRAREVAGKVEHEATVTPIYDERYQKIVKERMESVAKKRKNIVTIGTKEGKKAMIEGTASGIAEVGFTLQAKKPATSDKKERLPKDELINAVLAAFSEYPYWTFKALLERTGQPQNWLKEVINDILVLNKKGPYNGHYSLKPELAKVPAKLEGAGGSSSSSGGGGAGASGSGSGAANADGGDGESGDDDDLDDDDDMSE
ncbi:hypothetical protein HDU76_006299, partial [Blyttiomyces sp. JEL0837]